MTSFASSAELATYLGVAPFTGVAEQQATMLLRQGSAAIRNEVHQEITLHLADSVVLLGNWTSELVLPERPVSAVDSVTIDGEELVEDYGYTWDGKQTLRRGRWTGHGDGLTAETPGLHWGGPHTLVAVVYSHGYAVNHEKLEVAKAINLAMAKRSIDAPGGGLRSHTETLGPYTESVSFADAGGGSVNLSRSERRLLRRTFGR